jgi:parallel beta-helix repeat protein
MELFIRKNTKYLICYLLLFSLPLVLMPEPIYLAAQQVEEGKKLLEEGINAVKQGAYDVAIVRLEGALSKLEDKEKEADALFYLSISYFALKQINKTKELLTEMFKLNPKIEPDLELSPPEFFALWQEVKKENLASLFIETKPDKVEIYLDGERIGKSPLTLKNMISGEYKVRLEKDGYQSMEKFVTLVAGKENKLSFKLEKEAVKRTPQVAVTPSEKKIEVKKKSKAWIWLVVGGAAAAAAAMIVLKGGKGTTQPSEPITIRETSKEYDTIQSAINAASQGQHIDVATGTYEEHLRINKEIHIVGENKNNTIIDAGSLGGCVVVFNPGSNNASIIGFTLRDGILGAIECESSSPVIENNIIINSREGIYCNHSSPVIKWNEIRNNVFSGIHCRYNSNPVIEENTIINNKTGIFINKSKPDIGRGGRSNGNNKIRSNSEWDVYNDTYNLIKAENNCWDHATESDIDRNDIYDDDENNEYGPVDFVPFKTNCSSSQFSDIRFDISKLWLLIPSRVTANHNGFPYANSSIVLKLLLNNNN